MKTINLELSKRLAPYLENTDTENWYYKWVFNWGFPYRWQFIQKEYVKTLTLEESIEFLQKHYWDWIIDLSIYPNKILIEWTYKWKTLLIAIEKMLEYLLDNDLLW